MARMFGITMAKPPSAKRMATLKLKLGKRGMGRIPRLRSAFSKLRKAPV